MRKSLLQMLSIAALVVVLAGCASAAGAPAQPAATPSKPAAIAPTSTAGVQAARCTVSSQAPTANPTETSLYPPVTASDWTRGPANASVVFVEYGDFM